MSAYRTEDVRIVDLKPGMRLACQMQDGTIQPTGTIVGIEIDDYDGSVWVDVNGGYGWHEDANRIANDSSVAIAVRN